MYEVLSHGYCKFCDELKKKEEDLDLEGICFTVTEYLLLLVFYIKICIDMLYHSIYCLQLDKCRGRQQTLIIQDHLFFNFSS